MPVKAKVLILYAHPLPRRSRVNRKLVSAVHDLEGVTFHDLYAAYPDLDIDIKREQELLVAHDVLVWQHPFYWYSTPAMLKEWQDLVLEFGWAYGPGGTKLEGKRFLQVITTGGREEAYQPEGFNRFTMEQLLSPVLQTVRLCRMEALPPFVVHGTHRLTEADIDAHARNYQHALERLIEGRS